MYFKEIQKKTMCDFVSVVMSPLVFFNFSGNVSLFGLLSLQPEDLVEQVLWQQILLVFFYL